MLDWLAVSLVRDDLHAGQPPLCKRSRMAHFTTAVASGGYKVQELYFSFDLMTHELMPHLQYRRFSSRSMGFIKTCGFSIEEWFTLKKKFAVCHSRKTNSNAIYGNSRKFSDDHYATHATQCCGYTRSSIQVARFYED